MISAILTIITVSVIGGIAASVGSVMCGYGAAEIYNVVIGWAIAVSPFISWLLVVKITDGFKKRKLIGGLVAIAKYPIIAFAVYSMMKSGSISPTFVVVGLSSIIPAVIVGGILWNKQWQQNQANT